MDQKRGSTAIAVRRGGAYYRRLLAEQEASGRSLRAFAMERGLSPWTLYGWRGKLRQRCPGSAKSGAREEAGFVAVDVVGPSQGGRDFEVILADGCCVRVPCDMAIERLAELVAALRSC